MVLNPSVSDLAYVDEGVGVCCSSRDNIDFQRKTGILATLIMMMGHGMTCGSGRAMVLDRKSKVEAQWDGDTCRIGTSLMEAFPAPQCGTAHGTLVTE